MDFEHGNDNATRGCDGGTQTITIRERPGTRKIELEIDCLNLDVALSLLERTHREIEARYRFTRASELLAESQQNARIAEIAGRAMQRGPQRV